MIATPTPIRQADLYDLAGAAKVFPAAPVAVALSSPHEAPALATPTPQPTPTLTFDDELNALRTWLRTGGLTSIAPGRGNDADMAVADALIDLAQQHKRTALLPAGLEKLRSMTGLGSTSTVRSALGRLHKLVQRDIAGDRITKSDVYSLNREAIDHAGFTSRNPHGSTPIENNTVRVTRSENVYTALRAHDVFTTGSGKAGVQLGNLLPGAGKLLLLLIHTLINHAVPATGARLAILIGRNYNTVRRALARGHQLGLLERTEENGKGIGRRYHYTVAPDWEQRAALLAVDLRTYGAGVDRAADAALGLRLHAERLLNPTNEHAPPLDTAQRATLKEWSPLALAESQGLRLISDMAGQIDREAVKETIVATPKITHFFISPSETGGIRLIVAAPAPDHRNNRAMGAAKLFVRSVSPQLDAIIESINQDLPDDEKIGTKPLERLSMRLFQHWASLMGYYDLTGPDYHAHLRLSLAIKTARPQVTVQPRKPSAARWNRWSPLPIYTQPELGVSL